MPEMSTLVIRKEPRRKVISVMPPSQTRKADLEPVRRQSKKGSADKAKARQKRAVQSVVRYFQMQGPRKTCSVFGCKNVDHNELRLMRCVAQKYWPGVGLHFLGVAESAPSGPHAHFIVFVSDRGVPHPLPVNEETKLCDTINLWLAAWARRTNLRIRPSRFVKQKTATDGLEALERGIYRVPSVIVEGKVVSSGIQHYAVGYTLKTLLRPSVAHAFVASVGVGEVVRLARAHQQVRLKERRLWVVQHSTYRFDLVSIVAYEAEKQLRYLDPHAVSVYIKYGRVYVDTSGVGKLRLIRNKYLLVGLELLRRDLKDFTATSVLRRCVVKVCHTLCPELRALTSEQLQQIAAHCRHEMVWAAKPKGV